ncbi:MAG: helix-turn-helix transcriptional regulator [Acidimicrobiia bacterium]
MQVPELRGRSREFDALIRALEVARAGSGSTILLEGEAGIGKTRLLDELAARAQAAGVRVLRGSAEELEQGRPFGPLVDALGAPDTAPALTEAGRGADARYLAQDAFVDHVERLAWAGPTLLAIDDLHWADRPTVATLWALARRSTDLGLLLVLTFRPTPESDELGRVVEGVTQLGGLHLRLGPIPDDALAALAADVVGAPAGPALVDQLRGSRGNPFVAIELLRALEADDRLAQVEGTADLRAGELPTMLRYTLLRRFTALSGETRRALSVASVLGGTGGLEELALLLGSSVADAGAAVGEATRAGLLEPASDLVTFRHDLIREALYEDLPQLVRTGWHREAARVLAGRADPAVVARHRALGAAPGDADAVEDLRRTADELAEDQPEAAADVLATALTLTHEPQTRARLAADRAHALLAARRAEEAGEQADVVLAIGLVAPDVAARAYLARAEANAHGGKPARAVEDFAAARATGALDDATATAALGRQSENRLWTFALDQALEDSTLALASARRLGINAVVVEALAVSGAVHSFRAEFDTAIALGSEAVARAGDEPAALHCTPHAYLGLALLGADRLDEARAAGEEGRRRSTELGHVLALANYHALLARIGWFSGRWDDAVAELDSAASLADDFGLRFGERANQGVRGLIAFHRGDHDGARAALDQRSVAVRGRDEDAAGSELVVLLQAQMLEASGELEQAAASLRGLFEIERALGMDAARVWTAPACVRTAVAAGDRAFARGVAEDLEGISKRAGTASARGAAAHARGAVAGDGDVLDAATAEFAAAGRPLDRLVAREAAAHAHVASGRRDRAVASLRDALTVAEELGAAHDGRRVRASLRELGIRIGTPDQPGRPTEGWGSLTDAEREVAELVEDGLRNAEIAERLFVSRRTVETHVSRLYKKLGAGNRVALARAIHSAGEPARS